MRYAWPLIGLSLLALPAGVQTLERPFSVHFGGLKFGEGVMQITRQAERYEVRMRPVEAGFASWLADVEFNGLTQGSVLPGGSLRPDGFNTVGLWDGDRQTLDILYAEGDPISVAYVPEPDWLEGRPLPDPAEQGGTVDLLTVFAELLWPGTPEAPCRRAFEVFSGSRRTSIALDPAGPARDNRIECPTTYTRYETDEDGVEQAESFDFMVELRARDDGLWEADRVHGATGYGRFVLNSMETAPSD